MGMYTELVLKAIIKEDIPESVKSVLNGMFNGCAIEDSDIPDHPFFKTPRWMQIGTGNSYYHIPCTNSRYEEDRILSRSDLKNYDGEIELFIDWLSPYVETDGERTCIGWTWYEEHREPTLIFVEPTP